MAFKETAGSIIIDAVLTDLGRRRMTQGTFEIKKFGLGDDEVDYSHGNRDSGEYEIPESAASPILEAHAAQGSPIQYGLIDFTREDVNFMPILMLNDLIQRSVKKTNGVIYLSVNDETTKKLKSHLNIETQVLQNNNVLGTMLVVETGIDESSIKSTELFRDRFINNLDLFDKYVFTYTDKRLIDKILVNNPNAYYTNDRSGKLYQNLAPLSETPNISINNGIDNYQTSIITAVQSEIYVRGAAADSGLSHIRGAKAGVMSANFKVKQELISNSNGEADIRYRKLGKTAQTLFGGSEKYDYIDTTVKLQGCASKVSLNITLRIIRYAGT